MTGVGAESRGRSERRRGPATTLRSLLVGFGHASRDLHLPCLRNLPGQRVVGVVERKLPSRRSWTAFRLPMHADLRSAASFPPDETVVHVCVPPRDHASVIEEAADLGYRRFIVEKPLAASYADALRVAELERELGLDVVVVANWLSSALTERIRLELAGSAGAVANVQLRQMKPRISTSFANRGHQSAFDVEMPHIVALALGLFGLDVEVVRASAGDLRVNGVHLPGIGWASLVLRVPGGPGIRLDSHLMSPIRERSIRVTWLGGGVLRGYYPCGDSNDFYSQLIRMSPVGEVVEHSYYEDDCLSRFMRQAYSYFEHGTPKPSSDVALNAVVCRILEQAKTIAGHGRDGDGRD